MSDSSVGPGWYRDPGGNPFLRWWTGAAWTEQTQPLPGPAPTVPASPAASPSPSATPKTASETQHRGLFGARHRLEGENEELRQTLAEFGVTERDQLKAEIAGLRSEIGSLTASRSALAEEVGQIQAGLSAVGELSRRSLALETALSDLRSEEAKLQGQVVETRDTIILQEVGIYEYRHPAADSIEFKAQLVAIRAQIKDAVRAGNAVKGATNWTVNGSAREGTKMVREFSKLMLRAYNNEADSAVHTMKPYTLESATARLSKARDTIVKLGGTMNLRVTESYHRLRIQELELTADYLAKVADEKELEQQKRERMRDEAKAQREIEREQERLRKEQAHYLSTLTALQARGDHSGAAEAEAKLQELEDALDGINKRAANLRAGWVYVISNIGSFGDRMVKVGMTRRLDPMERVRELGDASVPFRYDVHAVVSSDDAVGLETHLHHELADRRVNSVNRRREFFYATPADVRTILERLESRLVSYVEEPEALEWRQSQTMRRQLAPVDGEDLATTSDVSDEVEEDLA